MNIVKLAIVKAIIIIVLVSGALGLTCNIPRRGYLQGTQILRNLPRNLPIGSNQSAVIAYLNSNNIEHSDYYIGDFPSGRLIDAIVREYKAGFILEADVTMKFSFDPQGNLTEYSVDVIRTGP